MKSNDRAMLEALHSKGPHAKYAEQLKLFGQFVGSWEVDITNYDLDGTVRRVEGEWHFGWVLEGRAIQDVWVAPKRSLRAGMDESRGEYGATLRF